MESIIDDYGISIGFSMVKHLVHLKCVDCGVCGRGSLELPAVKKWDALNKEKDHTGANAEYGNVDLPVIS